MTIDYFPVDCSICDKPMLLEAKFPLILGKVECPACWEERKSNEQMGKRLAPADQRSPEN